MQTVFTWLITVQFIVVALHDLVDIPSWTNASAVQQAIGRGKLWVVTLVNASFPAVATGFALYFWKRPKPGYVVDYWLIYCAVTLA